MKLGDHQIHQIVERVVERLSKESSQTSPLDGQGSRGIFENISESISAAKRAFEELNQCSLETRRRMIDAMRKTTLDHAEEFSRLAVGETGLGRVEDKINKNKLAALKTPGPEILVPVAMSGDEGLTLVERAPFGVIGAITPCTNATETIINNSISMVSAGNSVVFNVHPSAKKVCSYHISLLNKAIEASGGPSNVLCGLHQPTIESASALMKHPDIRLLAVTGGGPVVKAAMNSGKRAIAAGPGNPPVLVDETADLSKAADGIVKGASLDNNIVCICEKVLLVVSDVAEALKRELKKRMVIELSSSDIRKLEKLVITPDNYINRSFVGKNPSFILNEIGIKVGEEIRLILCEVEENHPFVQHEQLMPILPMVKVLNSNVGIAMSKRVEHNYGHTSVIYSRNIETMHAMARVMNSSIFVKNAPSVAGIGGGGEGYTSFTIASPTGEGLTTALSFSRERRCTLKEYFRII
jgi:acyl-CoA reductase-like NAD-dependent aldehyde dehydrogenase